ncbi:MAG TPA: hypothetical protein VIA18_13635 [Polyangia bacterium]|nr:hypothetical protein [Polyangia bacterium]
MIRRAFLVAVVVMGLSSGCTGPGHVRYDTDRCLIDGHDASLSEVEARQATVAQRIQSRQPWFAIVTIIVVVLAAASNAEKALVLFRARKQDHEKPLAERLREALERTRQSPLRFFAIVTGTILLLLAAGGTYIYLDVDKRASERALQMLQFCHLALATSEEQGVLAEQKRNLQSIQSTAGDIRALVDKLPPAEKQKAREMMLTMNTALDKQGKIVNSYLTRSDETTKQIQEQQALVQKGLSSLSSDLTSLKMLPTTLHELDETIGRNRNERSAHDAKIDSALTELDAKLKQLLARPICEPPPPPPPVKKETTAAPPSTPTAKAPPAPPAKLASDMGAAHP